MSGALVRRLNGWTIIPLFLIACTILVGCPIFIMPNRVGVSIGVFLGLVIAGSLHEIHRRARLGLPKPSDPFEFTAPLRILVRAGSRLARITRARLRGESIAPSSLDETPHLWRVIRDAYLKRTWLQLTGILGLTLALVIGPVLRRPSLVNVVGSLYATLVVISHYIVVTRRARLGLRKEKDLLMFVAPLRVLAWGLAAVLRASLGVERQPLFRLDAIARFFWSEKTYTRVFRAHQLEIIYEWSLAKRNGERHKANYIRFVRGPFMMLVHMVTQLPFSVIKLVFQAGK